MDKKHEKMSRHLLRKKAVWTKVRITKSEISMRTWRSPMRATSQGAFVVIPEIPSVDKGTHDLQRSICFCTLLSSLTVAPLRLAHSPRAEANIFSANFLGTWRLEISAQARPQDESLLDVSLRRERSMR